jgi:hypothetical protein
MVTRSREPSSQPQQAAFKVITEVLPKNPELIRVDPHPTLKLALMGDMQGIPAKEN